VEVLIGPEWKDVTGNWRKQHNEELYNSQPPTKYYSDDRNKWDRIGGKCASYGGGFGRKT